MVTPLPPASPPVPSPPASGPTTAATATAPPRFVLDRVHLASALAVAGVLPDEHSQLPRLPPPADRLSPLQSAELVARGGHELVPALAAALRVAAAPTRKVAVRASADGDLGWTETFVLHAREGPFVALRTKDERYELVVLDGAAQGVELVADLLGLPASASGDGLSLRLRLGAYAVLLACADAIETARLQSRLARQDAWKPVLTRELVAVQLEKGLAHDDARWAVAAGSRACPPDVRVVPSALDVGAALAALQEAGLLRPVQRGLGLTAAGEALTAALSGLARISGVALAVPGRDPAVLAHATVFCGPRSIVVCEWAERSPSDAVVDVRRADRADVLEVLRQFVDPLGVPRTVLGRSTDAAPGSRAAAVERRCPQCGRAVAAGLAFCTSCGTRMDGA